MKNKLLNYVSGTKRAVKPIFEFQPFSLGISLAINASRGLDYDIVLNHFIYDNTYLQNEQKRPMHSMFILIKVISNKICTLSLS